MADFSRQRAVPFHIHILETRVQRVTGTRLYGKSLIRLMADLDALHEMTSIAHAIWIDEDDVELIAAAGRLGGPQPRVQPADRFGSGAAASAAPRAG